MYKNFKYSLFLLLSTHLYAGGSHMNFALTGNKVNNSDYRTGAEFGIDMIKTFNNGIELGGALDAGIFLVKEYQTTNNEGARLVDFLVRAGYNFNNSFQIPLALRAGAGYAVGDIGTTSMEGYIYDIAGEYDFTTQYGVGVKYKKADLTLILPNDPKIDYSQIGCYLSVKF